MSQELKVKGQKIQGLKGVPPGRKIFSRHYPKNHKIEGKDDRRKSMFWISKNGSSID